MRKVILFLAAGGFMILLTLCPAADAQKQKQKQKYDPPANLQPSEEALKQIQTKTAQLAAKIAELRKEKTHADLLPDVEIYLRGAENIVRFEEFYNKDSVKWTLDSLGRGFQRAEQLAQGKPSWTKLAGKNVVRGYRSIIDGTAQPYGVTYPLDYGKDVSKRWRVDIVLHGRNATLTEVAFLNAHNGNRKISPEQDYVQIDIFGRGNNAYRWAGETDVLEAMEAFFAGEKSAGRGELPDRRRVVLRGFSMGGAGTWHLGLHYPDKWCVMGPGAGFTTTHGYAGGLPDPLPDQQERCLSIYDALDYAENARMIPIVAYSGGADPQKLAADNIEKRLQELNIKSMKHIIAPGLGHSFPAEWFKKANALWSAQSAKGRPAYPKRVSFVTYTLKYPQCDWLTLLGLDKHYEKSTVDAELMEKGFRITTINVRRLSLEMPEGMDKRVEIIINGQKLTANPSMSFGGSRKLRAFYAIYLAQEAGTWKLIQPLNDLANLKGQKIPSLQGPIDDAFARGFVCVVGSGDTWHPGTKKYVDAKLAAFTHDWAKHWRGELPTTGDYAVTPNDIKDKNLILFGDPNSNLTLAQIMPKLPLKWTKDEIEFAGQKFKAAEHVPVLIFPNPLNPNRYVVLNTGHTIPSSDYTKTNAMLFPRLGDYAVLRLTPNAKNAAAYEVATAGLFDEFWQIDQK